MVIQGVGNGIVPEGQGMEPDEIYHPDDGTQDHGQQNYAFRRQHVIVNLLTEFRGATPLQRRAGTHLIAARADHQMHNLSCVPEPVGTKNQEKDAEGQPVEYMRTGGCSLSAR